MTLDIVHAPIPDGSQGFDVWLDAAPTAALTRRLGAVLDPTGARLLGLDAARGSMWPLPVPNHVPPARLRFVMDLAEPAEADAALSAALRAITTVAEWSIVQRLESGASSSHTR